MPANGRMTWEEAVRYLTEFNQRYNITTKGGGPQTCTVVAVIANESLYHPDNIPFTDEQRSYAFTNHNKFFIPSNIGNSIFADCLDGNDIGIRLDWYINPGVAGSWKVEYCYIKEEVTN